MSIVMTIGEFFYLQSDGFDITIEPTSDIAAALASQPYYSTFLLLLYLTIPKSAVI